MTQKKAISPIVAVTLLLTIAVISTISFQNWVNTYTSTTLADTETQSNYDFDFKIEKIIGNSLYIKSNSAKTLTSFKIKDTEGNQLCNFEDRTESNLQADTILMMTFENQTMNTSTVNDLSGHNNKGTLYNTLYENNCIYGSCHLFSNNNSYISISHNMSLNLSAKNSITISTWAKSPDWNPSENWKGLINKEYGFYIHSTTEKIRFQINTNHGIKTIDTNNPPSTNIWHNFIGTWDGENMCIYMNKNLENCRTLSNTTISSKTFKLVIGKYNSYFFNGSIDEIAIYSKALTDDEINLLYDSRKALLYEQLLPAGVKEIDISSCNLTRDSTYTITTSTPTQTITQQVTAK